MVKDPLSRDSQGQHVIPSLAPLTLFLIWWTEAREAMSKTEKSLWEWRVWASDCGCDVALIFGFLEVYHQNSASHIICSHAVRWPPVGMKMW